MSEHTPGPWEVFGDLCDSPGIDAGSGSIVTYGEPFEGEECGVLGSNKVEAWANARLIAAAPDYDEHARVLVDWWDTGAPPPVPEHVAKALDGLRVAIAKAKGEQR